MYAKPKNTIEAIKIAHLKEKTSLSQDTLMTLLLQCQTQNPDFLEVKYIYDKTCSVSFYQDWNMEDDAIIRYIKT